MSVEFYGKTFDEYERRTSKPYLGFLTPKGHLVNYNTELGGSHGDLGNIVSWTFLLWIKQENIIEGLNLKDIDIMAKLIPSTGEIRNADIACYDFNKKSNLLLLQKDLLNFLSKVRNSAEFNNFINKRVDNDLFPSYVLKDRKVPLGGESIYEIESLFGRENTKRLLMILKDVCIQYLGYDAIERVKPNGEMLKLPDYYYLYPEDYLTIFDKPRTISTTHNNINERFYNYILMDWRIKRLDKYIYNENTNKFEVDGALYESDTDRAIKEELETIKKHVPIKERTKFFR